MAKRKNDKNDVSSEDQPARGAGPGLEDDTEQVRQDDGTGEPDTVDGETIGDSASSAEPVASSEDPAHDEDTAGVSDEPGQPEANAEGEAADLRVDDGEAPRGDDIDPTEFIHYATSADVTKCGVERPADGSVRGTIARRNVDCPACLV